MKHFSACAAVIWLLQVSAASAQIAETAAEWSQKGRGGKICMSAHEHYGESPPWASKRGATAAAIRQWENATVFEYGKAWSRYQMADGKRMHCNQEREGWICATTARPCRTN